MDLHPRPVIQDAQQQVQPEALRQMFMEWMLRPGCWSVKAAPAGIARATQGPLPFRIFFRTPMKPPIDKGRILITGASSGIGREIARLCAGRAAVLVLTARRTERLESLRDELVAANPRLQVEVESCDLADEQDVVGLADRAREHAGGVDVLVNNAGIGNYAPYDQVEWSTVERMIRVNVIAPALLIHELLPEMVQRRRGGILNIGSGAGVALMPAAATYVGTKHFLHGFTEVLRLDLIDTGVVVTEVCPGPVETEFDDVAGIGASGGGLPPTFKISAERCARESLAGFDEGQPMVFPGTAYKLLMTAQAFAPRRLQRRALQKAAREARAQAIADRSDSGTRPS
jgi:uncharacterized protein